jgi:methionine-S-sulfoxide reductase
MEQAIFAAGSFWATQSYFDQIPGVTNSTVGYTGGMLEDPTYQDVCSHTTGHAEAVLLEYNTSLVSFEILCKHFFHMHNPTQLDGQGSDVGDNYRSAIFYLNELQKEMAEHIRNQVQANWKEKIVTQIEPAGPFYEAEDYHQKYTERTGRGMCRMPYESLA